MKTVIGDVYKNTCSCGHRLGINSKAAVFSLSIIVTIALCAIPKSFLSFAFMLLLNLEKSYSISCCCACSTHEPLLCLTKKYVIPVFDIPFLPLQCLGWAALLSFF